MLKCLTLIFFSVTIFYFFEILFGDFKNGQKKCPFFIFVFSIGIKNIRIFSLSYFGILLIIQFIPFKRKKIINL